MDDDYSTDLLLASLLSDNIDDECDTVHTNTHQVSIDLPVKTPSHGSTQINATAESTLDSKAPQFDSLEDLLNATLSPSEESYSDKASVTSENASQINVSSSAVSTTPSPVVSKSFTFLTTSVGLPPKFRNTFKPVEVTDTITTTPEFCETTFKNPSHVVTSQTSTSSINNIDVLTSSSDNTWQQLKNKTSNDSVYPPSKRLCVEGHTSSYHTKSIPSVTAITTSSVNSTTSLPSNNMHSSYVLARTENNVITQQQHVISHPVVTTSVSLNGVNYPTNSSTATNAGNNAIDLKRLQENLVSDLQAASTKPISSASILHAIQVVQLNYSMLLQKLSQNIDDATAQEVKTKLMVLTHHYKQLAQQYHTKLSAEKTAQLSSNGPTTVVTTSTGSAATIPGHSQSTISNTVLASITTTTTPVSTVIDLTHDKTVKTTTTAVNKDPYGAVSVPIAATVQHSTNTTGSMVGAGANVSSYLQSIPSLAAYLLQNTEAQKQLSSMELQQLNQIRVNLLQEFQRRQVQNFLTSLPADTRPKNVNELKDMMKEKNFSIQIPPFLVAPVIKPPASLNTTQYKQETKADPLMTTGHVTDSKQVTMQAAPLSGHQQSVMATLLPHTMVNSVKPEEQPTSNQHKLSVLPVDVKPLTVTSQPQLFVGDMLQQLHNSQLAAGVAKLTAPTVSSTLASSATSQFVQGGTAGTAAAAAAAAAQLNNNLLKNNTHRLYPNAINPPRSKIMAHNIIRNIPGTSFSSKAAKYRAMAANVSSVGDVTSLSVPLTTKPSLHYSTSSSLTHSNTASLSSSSSTHYNTRAQLRTQRMMEEQKRLEEERIKQLTYTPEQLKTISNIKYFMQADHSRITKADTQTPFHSKQDAFQRLSAYHVYYEPEPSEAIENRVEQMHDILARELMKKSRGLMAKYHQLLLKDEQKQVPKHVELANERLFVEGELGKEDQQQKSDYTTAQKSADVTPVLDTIAMSKLSSLNSQLIHDINVLHYTNTAGSVGIT